MSVAGERRCIGRSATIVVFFCSYALPDAANKSLREDIVRRDGEVPLRVEFEKRLRGFALTGRIPSFEGWHRGLFCVARFRDGQNRRQS
jgi:hypothetical protein